MVKFNISFSRQLFRIVLFHNLSYWKKFIIRIILVLMFLPVFILGLIEDGFSFVLIVTLLLWLIPLLLLIGDLPFVSAALLKGQNVSYKVMIDNKGMHLETFNGSEVEISDYSFDKCKRIVERKKFFFMLFDDHYEYLLKSDIVEGSVEELRMICIGEAGEKCIGIVAK